MNTEGTPDKHFFQSKGQKAEDYIHSLAQETFLTDWCFLNPKLPDGKELCDLLVVFNDIAIIWQIKDLKLDENGKYKEAEVEKNIRQLAGARRQLFDLKTPITLKNLRRAEETLDPSSIKKIYLISVLTGEGEDMFSFIEEIKTNTVHVFTKDFATIVLGELDTISDFTKYLEEKEALVATPKSLMVLGGEEELLAVYLMNDKSFSRFDKADHVLLDEGAWKAFTEKPEYTAKKEADKISYGWDSIINRAHEGSEAYEKVARELARANRFDRRYLSKTFYDAHVEAHEDSEHDLLRRIAPMTGVTYCFLYMDEKVPRKGRISMLTAICWVARKKFPDNQKVIGIATEKKINETCSYDFCVLDIPELTPQNLSEIEIMEKENGLFINPKVTHVQEDEYPQ